MSSLYAVVEFLSSKTVAIIPVKWLTSDAEDRCYWPSKYNTLRTTKFVVATEDANKSWEIFSIRVIGKAATYGRARQKLILAEYTSDVQTDCEEPTRKKRRNTRYISSSDESDCDNDEAIIAPPPPPRSTVTDVVSRTSHNELIRPPPSPFHPASPRYRYMPRTLVSSDRTPRPPTSGVSTSFTRSGDMSPARITPVSDRVQPRSKCNCNEPFMKKVLSLLEDVRETQRIHGSLIASMLKKGQVEVDNHDLPGDASFPLKTFEDFKIMNQKLLDPAFEKGVVCYLSDLGGKKLQEAIKRIMQCCFTNDLSMEFNMTGRNNKKPLCKSLLFRVVCKAIKRNLPTQNANREDIERCIAKWLLGGRDREGNRARRADDERSRRVGDYIHSDEADDI